VGKAKCSACGVLLAFLWGEMGEVGKALHEAAVGYALSYSKVWLDLLSISWFSLLYSYVLPKRNKFSFLAAGNFSQK